MSHAAASIAVLDRAPLCLETVFGLRLSCATSREVLDFLERHCTQRGGGPISVFTANVDHLLRYKSDPAFAAAYAEAEFATVDGMPVLWAMRLLGRKPAERVTGIDLFASLLAIAERRKLRCFFLGARAEVLDKALQEIGQRFPGLVIAGKHHGYFCNDAPLHSIKAAHADIVFVAMGSPRQELWAAANLAELPVKLVLPIGGTLDIYAGCLTRAPRFLQRIGMEWLWRLKQEPRRLWKRYLIEAPKFLFLVSREWRINRRISAGTAPEALTNGLTSENGSSD
jgi:N-acetylglucosaminyldiphosphoundecaprenol N-acetyl-beta-D-mannosaminyltransferase